MKIVCVKNSGTNINFANSKQKSFYHHSEKLPMLFQLTVIPLDTKWMQLSTRHWNHLSVKYFQASTGTSNVHQYLCNPYQIYTFVCRGICRNTKKITIFRVVFVKSLFYVITIIFPCLISIPCKLLCRSSTFPYAKAWLTNLRTVGLGIVYKKNYNLFLLHLVILLSAVANQQ